MHSCTRRIMHWWWWDFSRMSWDPWLKWSADLLVKYYLLTISDYVDISVSGFDVNLFAAKALGLLTWPKVPGSEGCRVSGGQVTLPIWSRRIHWGLCQNLPVTMVTCVWKWGIPKKAVSLGEMVMIVMNYWIFSGTPFSDKPSCFEGMLIHDVWRLWRIGQNCFSLLPIWHTPTLRFWLVLVASSWRAANTE